MPTPPLVNGRIPDHPAVIDVACSNAFVGEPPKVKVTLESLFAVKAAGVTDGTSDRYANVPLESWNVAVTALAVSGKFILVVCW